MNLLDSLRKIVQDDMNSAGYQERQDWWNARYQYDYRKAVMKSKRIRSALDALKSLNYPRKKIRELLSDKGQWGGRDMLKMWISDMQGTNNLTAISDLDLTSTYATTSPAATIAVTGVTITGQTSNPYATAMVSGGPGLPTTYINTNTLVPPGSVMLVDDDDNFKNPKQSLRDLYMGLNYHRQPDGPYVPLLADGLIEIEFPDGAKLKMGHDTNYVLETKDAKVTYKGMPKRDFNRFINASERLEEFIKFCGGFGITKEEMLKLPVQHFIQWLVVEAAKADEVPEPEVPLIPNLKRVAAPHCVTCGRFMPRKLVQRQIVHCRPVCYEKALLAA